METTTPSRSAATSTWFSTTTGPEATKALSSGRGGIGAMGSATGGAAATLDVSLTSLQLARASVRIISGASARTRFIGPPVGGQDARRTAGGTPALPNFTIGTFTIQTMTIASTRSIL